MNGRWRIVILGLSLTSSWGNGHATTYRGLVKELCRNGHDVAFLERDVPWYAGPNRDMPNPPFGKLHLYRDCRWVLATARGVRAFYDIDTPVTLAKLARGDEEYIAADLVGRFDLYLSFTGGPLLDHLRRAFGAQRAEVLYCSFDPELYGPEPAPARWDLGYLGTYSPDRQPKLTELLIEPARASAERRFVVAGPQYPAGIDWPDNVQRIEHIPPHGHRAFYNAQAFTLNVTRADMTAAGWSPSVRLFEAAGCGVPVISDPWDGLDSLLRPDEEVLIARSREDVARYLRTVPEERRRAIGEAARRRVLAEHSAAARARQLEDYVSARLDERRSARRPAGLARTA